MAAAKEREKAEARTMWRQNLKFLATVIKNETQISSLGDWKDGCHRNKPNY